MNSHFPGYAAACLMMCAARMFGQEISDSNGADARKEWEFVAAAYAYVLPDERDYIVPLLTADHGTLHLEGRYNYEAIRTASFFVGWNFSTGEELHVAATPMIGVLAGDLAGIAPGYHFTLGYHRVSLYSEGEYAIATEKSSENFFYTWSELSYDITGWMHGGIVIQRTRVYETGLDLQRGLLVGFSEQRIEGTAYMLNAGWTTPTWVFSLAYTL